MNFQKVMLNFRKFAQCPNLLDNYLFIEELAPQTALANKIKYEAVEFNQLHECVILDSVSYYHSFYFLAKSNLDDSYCIFCLTTEENKIKPEYLTVPVVLYKIL